MLIAKMQQQQQRIQDQKRAGTKRSDGEWSWASGTESVDKILRLQNN